MSRKDKIDFRDGEGDVLLYVKNKVKYVFLF